MTVRRGSPGVVEETSTVPAGTKAPFSVRRPTGAIGATTSQATLLLPGSAGAVPASAAGSAG